MEILESTLQVNEFARRSRHLRIFSKGGLVKMHFNYWVSGFWTSVKALGHNSLFSSFGKYFRYFSAVSGGMMPSSPQMRLLAQAILISGVALITSSLTSGGTFVSTTMTYSTDYLSTYYMPGEVLVSDESGYLVKINPQTDESNRIGLTDLAVHTVESGENMSVLADRYGVQVETIMWQNNISNANTLRVGQILLIPPVDGVGYKVGSGDNLQKIANKYNVSVDSIIAQNGLDSEVIQKGQALFLPGAKPILPPKLIVNARNPSISRSATRSASSASPSTAVPDIGKMFIYPTNGKVTQKYHAGHYALDIADRSMPAVWAAAGGTVTKASSGTWGGGYGTHVIVDHGNGVKTLYAHLNSLNVSEGTYVNQGDVVGIMGNTGRVYGATGIHLHWEVTVDGVKVNPIGYF